jgi:hypothetical protein
VARGSAPAAATGPSYFDSRYQTEFSHRPGMPESASMQYPPANVSSIAAQTHMQGTFAPGQQSLSNETYNQYPQSIAASIALQSHLQGSFRNGYQPQQDASGQLPSAPRAEVPVPPNASIMELLALLRAQSAANPHQS